MFYDFFIYPIEYILRFLFELSFSVTDSYIISTILLSLIVSIVLLPFYYWADSLQKKERDTLNKLNPSIKEFKSVYNGFKLHSIISTYYKQNNYHPIYSMRSLMGLLIQLPFFIAAYHFLSTYEPIVGVSSMLFNDLGAPDQWITIGNTTINGMPFIMTAINLITSFLFVKNMTKGEEIQIWILSLVFLVLLYISPSLLVLYWTMNNLFSFFRYLIEYAIKVRKGKLEKGSLLENNYFIEKYQVITSFIKRISLFELLFIFSLMFIYSIIIIYYSGRGVNYTFGIGLGIFSLYLLSALFILFMVKLAIFKKINTVTLHKFEIFKKSDLLLILLPITPILQYVLMNQGILKLYGTFYIAIIPFFSYIFVILIIPSLLSFFGSRKVILSISLSLMTILSYMPLISIKYSWYESCDIEKLLFMFLVLYLIIYYSYKYKGKLLNFIIIIIFLSTILPLGYDTLNSDNSEIGTFIKTSTSSNIIKKVNSDFKVFNPLKIKTIEKLKISKLKHKPDIFLLIYDAYPTVKTMKKVYNIDNSNQEKYLKDTGFKMYEDTYSIGPASLESLSATLNMSDSINTEEEARILVSGKANTYSILKNNGYKLGVVLENTYMFGYNNPNFDFVFPNKLDKGYIILWRSILMGAFSSDAHQMFSLVDMIEFTKNKRKFMEKSKNPKFLYTHMGPSHSLVGIECRKDEISIWEKKLRIVNIDMKKDIDTIIKNNPNSIIIVAGDHGPYLKGKCLFRDVYDSPDKIKRINIQDTFGAFLAVKWPKGLKPLDSDISVVQDIFPAIFSTLLEDEKLFNKLKGPTETFDVRNAIAGVKVMDGVIVGGQDDGKPLFKK